MRRKTQIVAALAVIHGLACAARVAPNPCERCSLQDAVALVVERIVTDPVFDGAVEIPICVDDRNAKLDTADLVRQFARHEPRARTCTGRVFVHPVYVHIGSIVRLSNGDLLVHAGHFCGNLCGSEGTFKVEVIAGRWQVVQMDGNRDF